MDMLSLWRPAGVDPETGRMYYFNRLTRETAWERPIEGEPDPSGEAAYNLTLRGWPQAGPPPSLDDPDVERPRSLTVIAADQRTEAGAQYDDIPPFFYRVCIKQAVLQSFDAAKAPQKVHSMTQFARGGWVQPGEILEAETRKCVDGKFYVELQGRGWLAEVNEEGTRVLDRIAAEYGRFTYRVHRSVGLRRNATLDKEATEAAFGFARKIYQVGDIVDVDMRVAAQGTVFVRITPGGGWLFIAKDDMVALKPVLVEEGKWQYRAVEQNVKVYATTSFGSAVNGELKIGACLQAVSRVSAEHTTFVKLGDSKGWAAENAEDGTPLLETVVFEVPPVGSVFTYKVKEGCNVGLRATASMELRVEPTMFRQTVGLIEGTTFEADLRVRAEANTFVRLRPDPNLLSSAPVGWVFESMDGRPVIEYLGNRKLTGGAWTPRSSMAKPGKLKGL